MAALSCAAFLTLDARGDWGSVLWWRAGKLAALAMVGAAVAIGAILLQTVSGNRVLTPSIMGFDSLHVLLHSCLVFALGAAGYDTLSAPALFAASALLLAGAALTLFGALLGRARQDVPRLVLVGVIFGMMFRSLANLVQRMIDPNDYAVVQVISFARFNRVETELLPLAAIVIGAALAAVWRLRHQLDVVALGREHAVSLGVPYRRVVFVVLALIAALVSASTALVGPVAFLGLLIASLARWAAASERLGELAPVAVCVAVLVMVGGQALLEHALGFDTALRVVVELLGGAVFLGLLLGRRVR